jgi:hypothetical protein
MLQTLPSMMPTIVTVAMSVSMCGRIQIDLRGRPMKKVLQPTTDESQQHHADCCAKLPPKTRQPARTVAGHNSRPNQCREDTQKKQRRPRTFTEDRPKFLPVDRGEPPGDPQKDQRPTRSQLPNFACQIAKIANDFPKRRRNTEERIHGYCP